MHPCVNVYRVLYDQTFTNERMHELSACAGRRLCRPGNFYQTLEKFEEAEGCYRTAAELDSSHIDSMNNLAMILQEKGDIDEAEAYYLRCVEVDDKCVDAMFNWRGRGEGGRGAI